MVADNINRLSHDKTPYVIYRQKQEVCGVKAIENFGRELYGKVRAEL